MCDIVQVHITSGLPIRAHALPFANRVEVRFGKAFPVALIVDRDAVDSLIDAINTGREGLDLAKLRTQMTAVMKLDKIAGQEEPPRTLADAHESLTCIRPLGR